MPSYLVQINGQSYIRQGLPATLVGPGLHGIAVTDAESSVTGLKVETLPPPGATDPRDDAERRLMDALSALFARLAPSVAARLARGEMPEDAELQDALAAVIQPALVETAVDEFERLGVQVGVQWDPLIANQQAIEWARTYTYDLVKGLTDTTRKTLQDAFTQFQSTPGMTRAELEGLISGAFSPARAESIAITEVTRGAQAGLDQYTTRLAEAGIAGEQVYHTAWDDRVCPVCSPDNNKPESEWEDRGKPPRHSRCRCFCTWRVKPEAKSAEVKFNPHHDRLGRFATAGSAGGAGGQALATMQKQVAARIAGGFDSTNDASDVGTIIEKSMAEALAPYDRVVASADRRQEKAFQRVLDAPMASIQRDDSPLVMTYNRTAHKAIESRRKRDEVRDQLTQEALSRIRPMGPDGPINFGRMYATDRPEHARELQSRATIESVAKLYPTAWWKASSAQGAIYADVAGDGRGFYQHGIGGGGSKAGKVALSSRGTGGALSPDVAIHELGHRFSYVVPNAYRISQEFYNNRTPGEKPQSLGAGYRQKEIARPDRFFHPYVGRVYSHDSNEILSMGFEAVLGTDYRQSIQQGDATHYRIALGLLAGL